MREISEPVYSNGKSSFLGLKGRNILHLILIQWTLVIKNTDITK